MVEVAGEFGKAEIFGQPAVEVEVFIAGGFEHPQGGRLAQELAGFLDSAEFRRQGGASGQQLGGSRKVSREFRGPLERRQVLFLAAERGEDQVGTVLAGKGTLLAQEEQGSGRPFGGSDLRRPESLRPQGFGIERPNGQSRLDGGKQGVGISEATQGRKRPAPSPGGIRITGQEPGGDLVQLGKSDYLKPGQELTLFVKNNS